MQILGEMGGIESCLHTFLSAFFKDVCISPILSILSKPLKSVQIWFNLTENSSNPTIHKYRPKTCMYIHENIHVYTRKHTCMYTCMGYTRTCIWDLKLIPKSSFHVMLYRGGPWGGIPHEFSFKRLIRKSRAEGVAGGLGAHFPHPTRE